MSKKKWLSHSESYVWQLGGLVCAIFALYSVLKFLF